MSQAVVKPKQSLEIDYDSTCEETDFYLDESDSACLPTDHYEEAESESGDDQVVSPKMLDANDFNEKNHCDDSISSTQIYPDCQASRQRLRPVSSCKAFRPLRSVIKTSICKQRLSYSERLKSKKEPVDLAGKF
jgi:hypothetical protein